MKDKIIVVLVILIIMGVLGIVFSGELTNAKEDVKVHCDTSVLTDWEDMDALLYNINTCLEETGDNSNMYNQLQKEKEEVGEKQGELKVENEVIRRENPIVERAEKKGIEEVTKDDFVDFIQEVPQQGEAPNKDQSQNLQNEAKDLIKGLIK